MRETFQVEKGSAREEVLLSAAQAGQEWAFAELCSRHARRTLFVLYKITKNREDAEDAFQDSVLKAFVHFGEFNRASTFATWFTRIAINSALMILRRKRTRPEGLSNAPTEKGDMLPHCEIADRRPNPEDYYIQLEGHRRLQAAISKLPTRYRRVFEIRQRSDGSIKEIAEEAGITIAATKSRLLRARQALRNSIW